MVNGDVYTAISRSRRLDIGRNLEAQLVLVPNPPQHPHGDFGLERGLATAAGSPRFTFSGIAVYRPAFFDGRQDGVQRLKPLWVECMGRGRCGGELFEGTWEDVGTPERLEALNR